MNYKDKINTFKNLTLISQIGISAATPIIIAGYVGPKIDNKFGTKGVFSIIFIVLGAGAGMMNIYKIGSKKKTSDEGKDE